ncbi:hypothetical protein EJ104_00495 [Deinococcus radiophilus]|uniref:Uncharacterized protein n=2 Tax=Deinococcus radiophilus TaxID=32062 RepID=A0A3S0IEW5_9DEIO|nr:hypothetical protein EJ104_00495 [Deinococcus radiophilus]
MPPSPPQKGVRGFDLDMHLTFAQPLPRAQALALVRALPGLTAEPYARPDQPGEVPSLRLTGPPPPWDELRPVLAGWLAGPVRVAEVGLRGYLRSAEGYTEWVPWRRNVILRRDNLSGVQLREGEKYVLE